MMTSRTDRSSSGDRRIICVAAAILIAQLVPVAVASARAGKGKFPKLSDKEVIALFVPNDDHQAKEARGSMAKFDASVDSRLATNLGLRGRQFLIAAVSYSLGGVPNWPTLEIGIVDVGSKKLLWHVEYERVELETELEPIDLIPNSKAKGFSFREKFESDYGTESLREHWFQPFLRSVDSVGCDEIWSATLELGDGGNRGGHRVWMCAVIDRKSDSQTWELQAHEFFAELRGCPIGTRADEEAWAALDCSSRVEAYSRCGSTVEVARTERWRIEAQRAIRAGMDSRRLDHAVSEVFPFNLLQRTVRWKVVGYSQVVDNTVSSPAGNFRVSKVREVPWGDSVELDYGAARVRVLIPENDDGYGCHVESLGWAAGGERTFAVVKIANERALLSFGMNGSPDYWEQLLKDDEGIWDNGFILKESAGP